jgi:hypothetical protein
MLGRLRTNVGVWIIPLALCMVLSPLFLLKLDDLHNFQGDETLWLAVSNKLFRLYIIDHNTTDPAWREEFSTFGSSQPQIGKYLIGLGTYAVDYIGEPYSPYHYNWAHDLAWNMEHRGVPPAGVVATGRLPVAILGLLGCLIFYWLIALITNWWTALLATASFAAAGLLTESSRRAMVDTPALAFGLLSLVGVVYLIRGLRSCDPKRAIAWSAFAGLACGLAIGTKLNTLLMVGVCVITILSEALIQMLGGWRRSLLPLLCLTLICVCAGLVVYVSNPFLYHNTITGVYHLLALGSLVATIPIDQLTTPAARIQAIWQSTSVYAPLARLGQPYDRWLLLLGAIGLVATARRNWASFRARQLDLIVLWVIVSYVGITAWLPHPWDRYYLPLQPCNALLQAYGVVWLLERIHTWKQASPLSHASTE